MSKVASGMRQQEVESNADGKCPEGFVSIVPSDDNVRRLRRHTSMLSSSRASSSIGTGRHGHTGIQEGFKCLRLQPQRDSQGNVAVAAAAALLLQMRWPGRPLQRHLFGSRIWPSGASRSIIRQSWPNRDRHLAGHATGWLGRRNRHFVGPGQSFVGLNSIWVELDQHFVGPREPCWARSELCWQEYKFVEPNQNFVGPGHSNGPIATIESGLFGSLQARCRSRLGSHIRETPCGTPGSFGKPSREVV